MSDLVLFDLDGTLLDTAEGITKGIEFGLEKSGIAPLPYSVRRRFIGPPLRGSFMKYCGIDAEMAEQVLVHYREYYGETGIYECKPYEGIRELLAFLKERGYTLYTATAKPTQYAVSMLEKWELSGFFKDIIGASFDKSLETKEKIIKCVLDMEQSRDAVMIGDTVYDIEGARLNSIPSIGVLYGFGSKEEIMAAEPDFIAETVGDIYSRF